MPTVLLAYYCALVLVASIVGGMIPLWITLTHRRMELAVSFVAGVMLGVGVLIMLPHAMRFNREAAAAELASAAEALGIARAGRDDAALAEAAVQQVYELIGGMGLPQRLSDAGLPEADLPRLAQLAFESRTVRNNPQPITDAGQLEALLRAAW